MTQKLPEPKAVIDKYLVDREKIKAIKRQAKEAVEEIERFQRNREDYLLKTDDIAVFEFFTDLYVHGRDGKAEKEKEKQDIGLRQDAIEKWLLKMLSKVGEGIRTSAGTVFKTTRESVTVESWDAFMEAEILRPAVEGFIETFAGDLFDKGYTEQKIEDLVFNILRTSAHFELLNKAVNKTAALEIMGDKDEKSGSRPNPPPAGIKYVALATVGVRKGK